VPGLRDASRPAMYRSAHARASPAARRLPFCSVPLRIPALESNRAGSGLRCVSETYASVPPELCSRSSPPSPDRVRVVADRRRVDPTRLEPGWPPLRLAQSLLYGNRRSRAPILPRPDAELLELRQARRPDRAARARLTALRPLRFP